MAEPIPPHDPLDARFQDVRLIGAALRRAVRDALLEHKRAGNPVCESREGQVVWIAPEDIVIPPEE